MSRRWVVACATAVTLLSAGCPETDRKRAESDGGASDAAAAGDAATSPNADTGPAPTEHDPQDDSIEYLCTPGLPGACNNTNDCPAALDGSAKTASSAC